MQLSQYQGLWNIIKSLPQFFVYVGRLYQLQTEIIKYPVIKLIIFMKFVACEAADAEIIEEISSDEESTSRKRQHSKISRKSFTSRPLTIRAPFVSILIEEEPQKSRSSVEVITLEESDGEDLYILSNQNDVIFIKTTPKTQTCSICLQDVKLPAAKISCGHVFCEECITQSSKLSNKCPNCRARFKKITVGSRVVKIKSTEQEEIYVEDDPCYVCGRNDRFQQLLMCDHCQYAFCHVSCDSRLEGQFPMGDWFCFDCTLMGRHRN